MSSPAENEERPLDINSDPPSPEQPDFNYCDASSLRPYHRKLTGASGWSKYMILKPRAKSRVIVDEVVTSQNFREIFGDHESESGWALPKKHRRHLLNFPVEVLTRILSFVLVAPRAVTPVTVSCNLWSHWCNFREPSYYISAPINHCGLYHSPGSDGSTFYDGWYRNPIDATIMRTAKIFHFLGLPLLYGCNDFLFDLRSYESEKQYKHMDEDSGRVIHMTNDMPDGLRFHSDEVQDKIRSIYNAKDPKELPDWIYLDPFTRFLHTIGRQNSSHIRKLRFIGTLHPQPTVNSGHPYWRAVVWIEGWAERDLANHIKIYTPFVRQYCPNIETLGIGVSSYCSSHDGKQYSTHYTDPEDEYDQIGDETIVTQFGKEALKSVRACREKNRLIKEAKRVLDFESSMDLKNLKPLVDELTPLLGHLQRLELKRHPVMKWSDFRTMYDGQHKSRELDWVDRWDRPEVTWYGDREEYWAYDSLVKAMVKVGPRKQAFTDIEIAADEAKLALSVAVKKRSDEMEAANKSTALNPGQEISKFTSQLELGDKI